MIIAYARAAPGLQSIHLVASASGIRKIRHWAQLARSSVLRPHISTLPAFMSIGDEQPQQAPLGQLGTPEPGHYALSTERDAYGRGERTARLYCAGCVQKKNSTKTSH